MSYQENELAVKTGILNSVNQFFASAGKQTISPQQLKTRMKRYPEKLLLLDIRSKTSFEEFHLEGSVSVPPDGWSNLHHGDFDADKEIVVICQRGAMSPEAVRILKERGYQKVMALRGGIDLWQDLYH